MALWLVFSALVSPRPNPFVHYVLRTIGDKAVEVTRIEQASPAPLDPRAPPRF